MIFAMGDDLSYGLNTLGPLCLWQCLSIMINPGCFIHTFASFCLCKNSQTQHGAMVFIRLKPITSNLAPTKTTEVQLQNELDVTFVLLCIS